MPTRYFRFTPSPTTPPFRFSPMLDDNTYVATVFWNTWAQRWFITLDTVTGEPVFNQGMTASPQFVDMEDVRWEDGLAIITATVIPPTFRIGDTFTMAVSDCLPEEFNTPRVQGMVLNSKEIMYRLPVRPPLLSKLGRVTYDINYAGGYFQRSSLLFRQASQQFEAWSP